MKMLKGNKVEEDEEEKKKKKKGEKKIKEKNSR